MKCLSVFVCLLGSALSHWGLPQPVVDTPEVAAAKSAHLAELARANARSRLGPEDDGSYRPEHHEPWEENGWVPQHAPRQPLAHHPALHQPLAPHAAPYQPLSHHPAPQQPLALHAAPYQPLSHHPAPQQPLAHHAAPYQPLAHHSVPHQPLAHPAQQHWIQAPHQWVHPATHHWAHPATHHWEQHPKWTGPVALPPGFDKNGAPLPVLDTPEVAAEKRKHFHLYSHGAYAAAAAHPHKLLRH